MATNGLDRGLTILEKIGAAPGGRTAQELADLIGIHKTNVYRYLHTLTDRRYIRRDPTGRFHLAYRVLELGSHVLQQIPLREAAHEHLLQLSRETGKTIHLCVLEESEVLYVDKIEGPQTLPMRSRIGTRVPAHCTASGKILLAYLPPQEQRRIVAEMVLERRTPSTILDREELLKEVQCSGKQGFAVDHGENEEHICCFAAPVFEQTGRAVAAISLTGLSSELVDPAEHVRIQQLVLIAGKKISMARGYVPHPDSSDALELESASPRSTEQKEARR